MKIERLISAPMSVNTYIVMNEEEKKAVVIDCGGSFGRVTRYCAQNSLKLVAAIFTHGHFDHTLDAAEFKKIGIPLYISKKDAYMLSHKDNLAHYAGYKMEKTQADETFEDGDELNLAGINFKVISTKGHTEGSVCFLSGDTLFCGDTIFLGSIGRTDFPTGNEKELEITLRQIIFAMDDGIKLLPGHGEYTTVGNEKKTNPYAPC